MNNVVARRSCSSLAPPARAGEPIPAYGASVVGKSKSPPRNDILRIAVTRKFALHHPRESAIIFLLPLNFDNVLYITRM